MENHNPHVRETDAARQGEVVFGKPWKRKAFFGTVIALAVVGLIIIVAVI